MQDFSCEEERTREVETRSFILEEKQLKYFILEMCFYKNFPHKSHLFKIVSFFLFLEWILPLFQPNLSVVGI